MTIPFQAKSAFIISALLAELDNLSKEVPSAIYSEHIERTEKAARRLYDQLTRDIPDEFLNSRAADMGVKAAHMSFAKIEAIYSQSLTTSGIKS